MRLRGKKKGGRMNSCHTSKGASASEKFGRETGIERKKRKSLRVLRGRGSGEPTRNGKARLRGGRWSYLG